ncbi:hypothetical protein [Parapedobacter koreensis]|uniref:DUF4374 domain-containing protein n=1 Tax=Parapedobacter koreensis TaxID=332977 RepID=A0A1H7S3F9_9SPHI|nr:hypothetical protein [Parapedobacter koreensis]SEL66816.1 hypothetical protein SAMN05421740_10846 [Parapedobacter koreensis]
MRKYVLYYGLLACWFLACMPAQHPAHHTKQTTGTYSLYMLTKDDGNCVVIANNLEQDSLSAEVDGIPLSTETFDRSMMVKNGHYYHIDKAIDQLVKYRLTADSLQALATLPMADKHIENSYWSDDHTLILFTLDDKTYATLEYHVIDVDAFKLIRSGIIDLPKSIGDYNTLSIGFSNFRQHEVIIGYCYHQYTGITEYTTIDTLYTAILAYPSMALKAIHKDARSAYPGGINTVQSYNFTDEKGDFYFMSCPGIALGNMPDLPTAIFKIPAAADTIDPDYWINISEQIGNHAYGMWSIGYGKAIIRSERKDKYTNFSDHHSTYQFEYYVVDLTKQSLTKLDLPLDKGTRKESVLVQGDKAYIAIDDAADNHQLWVYDIPSGAINPGLKLTGGTDYILRVDFQ